MVYDFKETLSRHNRENAHMNTWRLWHMHRTCTSSRHMWCPAPKSALPQLTVKTLNTPSTEFLFYNVTWGRYECPLSLQATVWPGPWGTGTTNIVSIVYALDNNIVSLWLHSLLFCFVFSEQSVRITPVYSRMSIKDLSQVDSCYLTTVLWWSGLCAAEGHHTVSLYRMRELTFNSR